MNRNLMVFDRLYGKAKTHHDLPWHDPEPPPMLVDVLDHRAAAGRALAAEVALFECGASVHSRLYL